MEKRGRVRGGVGRVTDDLINREKLAVFALPESFCGGGRDAMIGEVMIVAA